ncbi:hypothetical protein E2562_036998 [Oryza meyeriana var. granulata]|uniref:Uncharacterized protein n=1 Tax=Oryza meyeriana var. granulata TaxID=110450 RepID=A0A6G1F1X9_9ORYZ|nr:hypothetical protein E2562_036998 [Oryza meyeriana var. granulata]KAF0930905.1 hypothetical protein E2562_036998 [Oryza meyeriana var. granulata]KAF0930906.1 hypothetical protein E2562_036998 [Oryza meyeriana var. granulata]KAF0930907.1 hypothetical protein E2562_036998 [Oryza meyeriana var. granulata]
MRSPKPSLFAFAVAIFPSSSPTPLPSPPKIHHPTPPNPLCCSRAIRQQICCCPTDSIAIHLRQQLWCSPAVSIAAPDDRENKLDGRPIREGRPTK